MRTHRFGTILAALAVGGFTGVVVAGPVHAETTSHPASELRLSIAAAETYGMTTSWARGTTLQCDPAGGDHPAAEEACEVLTQAGGDFDNIVTRSGACTLEHAPVRVTAHGHWEGTPVTFDETYPNRCHANSATGGVFDF